MHFQKASVPGIGFQQKQLAEPIVDKTRCQPARTIGEKSEKDEW